MEDARLQAFETVPSSVDATLTAGASLVAADASQARVGAPSAESTDNEGSVERALWASQHYQSVSSLAAPRKFPLNCKGKDSR